jgi:alpha-glucosidase (family GH31 glycosyl hydrolase)
VPSPQGPPEELFARWLQFSAWSPLMEVLVGGKHTPWYDYSPRLVEVTRAQAALHHDLIPYLRSVVRQATLTGMPAMRQLLFDNPDEASLYDTWDEYLLGPSLLVAPVLQDGARQRSVYLPRGRWLDYHDRKTVHEGGATITAEAPLARLPLFVKEGAVVPRGDILKSNNTWTPAWQPRLRIEVFAAREGSRSFSYFTGRGAETLSAATAGGALTVRYGDLGVPGEVEIYVKGHGAVRRNGARLAAKGLRRDPATGALVIPFRGPTEITVDGITSLFQP